MRKLCIHAFLFIFIIVVFSPESAISKPISHTNYLNPSAQSTDIPEISFSTYWGGGKNDDIKDVVVDSSGNIYVTGVTNSTDFTVSNPACSGVGCESLYGDTDAFISKFDSSGNLVFSTYLGGSNDDSGNGITIGQDGNIYIIGTTSSYDLPGIISASGSDYYQYLHGGTDAFIAVVPSTGGSISYSMYVGGTSDDKGNKIYVDDSNIVTIAMYTESDGMPTLNNVQTACGNGYCGNSDGFLFRYINQTYFGQYYGTYFGGSGDDSINDLTVDDSGNIILTGWTTSTDLPLSNAYQTSNGGGTDAFVAKLTPNDIYNPYAGYTNSYTTYLGGSAEDIANAIDENNDYIYVTGYTKSSNFPTLDPIIPDLFGDSDAFVAKYNSAMQQTFSTYMGGTGEDQANDIKVNDNQEVYIVGWTSSYDFYTVNPIQNTLSGQRSAFIVKTDSAGSYIYSTYLGGDGQDGGTAVGVSDSGTVTVAGYTNSSDFPTENAIYSSSRGEVDGFVVNLSEVAGGSPVYSSTPGTSSSIDFGDTLIGGSSTQTVTVSNTGTATLNITDVTLSGDDASDFTATPTSFSIDKGGASQTISLTCTPSVTGSRTAQLTVTHNASNSPATYTLTCNGTEPIYSSSPNIGSDLDFGDITVGEYDRGTLTVSNTGTATLSITNVVITGDNSGDFNVDKTSFSINASGDSVTIIMTCTPQGAGERTATLSIYHNASGSPATYTLHVNGVEPAYSSTPVSGSTITFNDTVVNSSSKQTLKVGNTGTAILTISDVALSGDNASDFSVTPTTLSIESGGSDQAIKITCSPSAAGQRTATLTVTHNGDDSPATYSLSCIGTVPIYSSSPTSGSTITFDDTLVGAHSSKTLTVSNIGTATLNVTGHSLTGTDISNFSVTPTTLSIDAGGVSQNIMITCSPTVTGTRTATLTVTHNAEDSPATYSLSCNGVAPIYSSSPTSGSVIHFGITTTGSSSSKTLTVSNTGTATLTVSGVALSGDNATDFRVTPTSLSIDAGGASQDVTITCTPSVTGTLNATLTVTHNASGSPATYSLRCYAVAPPVYSSTPAVSSTIAFGNVVENTSKNTTLAIANTGGSILNITDAVLSGSNADKFSVTPTSLSVISGSSDSIKVTCSPTEVADLTATLTITHNTSDSPAVYSLTCSGILGAEYDSDPDPGKTIDFGDVIQKNSSTSILTVYNTGDATLEVTDISISGDNSTDFSIDTSSFSIDKGGASKDVTITCTPSAMGIRTATLTVTHSATGSPATYTLSCTGVDPPAYSSGPVPSSTITFDDTLTGSTSSSTLTVSNTGGSTLKVSGITITGTDASDFDVTPTSFSIAANGASHTVTIDCSPSSTGTKTATLNVVHNANGSPATYALSCTGIAPVYDSTPEVETAITFTDTIVDSSSDQTLLVSNTGTATLNVTSITLKGSHASDFTVSTTSFSVDAGSSQSITITCTPTGRGNRIALMTVTHNASGSPALYGLSCAGVAPVYVSEPTVGTLIGLGRPVVGKSNTDTLIVSNTGDAPLIVSNIVLSGENSSDFSVSETGFSILAGGGQKDVTITCTPTATGIRTATLTVTHNASDSPATYQLTCTGIAPVYDSTPSVGDTIDFGDVLVNENDSATLEVSNTGDATLDVTSVSIIGDGTDDFNIDLISIRKPRAVTITRATFSIPAGGAPRSLLISCNPSVNGKRTAKLVLVHNASGSPAEYPLTCNGVAPIYKSEPSRGSYIYFPKIPVGNTTTSTLIVSNIGNGTLKVSGAYINGRDASRFSISPTTFSIDSGGNSQSITLSCTTINSGELIAVLNIPYNGTNSPAKYNLSCKGIHPVYASYLPLGSTINFGDVVLNKSSKQILRIKNVGTDILNISNITITGSNASDFSVSPESFSLEAGLIAESVQITCNPAAIGTRTATLSVIHNAAGSPATYGLSCIGVQSPVTGSTANAAIPSLKNIASPDEILATTFTNKIVDTTNVADGIQTTGQAVPYSFDGNSLLATKDLPVTLGGISITVTDSSQMQYPAGIFSVSPYEINWLMPTAVADGMVTATFYKSGVKLMDESIIVARTSPGFFTANAKGSGLPVGMILRIKIDGSEILEPVSVPVDVGNSKDQVFLVLCGTGIRYNSEPITATIGGRSVQVYYSGPTTDNPGLDQVNLNIPRELMGSGDVIVNVSFGGKAANPVSINIK